MKIYYFSINVLIYRVGADLGLLRFCLRKLNKALFLFKGSFVVCQAGIERAVSFDNGAEGSIAEDTYFAMSALTKGYSFDWIEGEMWEKSPFSVKDFLQQRKRWIQGIFLVVHDKEKILVTIPEFNQYMTYRFTINTNHGVVTQASSISKTGQTHFCNEFNQSFS